MANHLIQDTITPIITLLYLGSENKFDFPNEMREVKRNVVTERK